MLLVPDESPGRGKLAENVMHFARILRGAGLRVGPDRVIDCMKAIELAGTQLVTALATREPADALGAGRMGGDGRLELIMPARYGAVLLPAL